MRRQGDGQREAIASMQRGITFVDVFRLRFAVVVLLLAIKVPCTNQLERHVI